MNHNGHLLDNSSVYVRDALEGDQVAFKKLYDSISSKMFGVCLRYSSSKDEANDMFQEGFLRLYRNLSNYRFEGSFEGWARRIFVTNCLDIIKKKKVIFSDIDETAPIVSNEISTNSKLDNDDLIKVVQSLPEMLRTIVNLSLIEEYSHKEIAELLNITESNSKSKLHKARKILKERLSELNAY